MPIQTTKHTGIIMTKPLPPLDDDKAEESKEKELCIHFVNTAGKVNHETLAYEAQSGNEIIYLEPQVAAPKIRSSPLGSHSSSYYRTHLHPDTILPALREQFNSKGLHFTEIHGYPENWDRSFTKDADQLDHVTFVFTTQDNE